MSFPAASSDSDLDRWLLELSSDRARLVYLSAVPLWLDSDILMVLHDSRDKASMALQILHEHLLVTSVSRKRVIIRPEARRHLLRAGWNGKLPDYVEVNSRLASYCSEQIPAATEAQQFKWARAALYHQIVSEQEVGWQHLGRLYEDAEKRGLDGAALQVLEPLRELRPLLTADDRATLVYYRARAALLGGQLRKAECLLRAVTNRGRPVTVVGVACRSLGQVLAARQHWSEALHQFRQSELILKRIPSGDPLSLALTQLGIGDMYQEMAEFSGGIVRTPSSYSGGQLISWIRDLLNLPVILYRLAGYSFQRLPFIDVGFSYQNWIAARLMLAAEVAYRRTIRIMTTNPSAQALYEARLGLARVYTKLNMSRRANDLINELSEWNYVNESEYRQAQVNFRRAELVEAEGKNALAENLLQQVIKVFSTYQQQQGLAAAYQRWANLVILRGDVQAGVAAYKQSAALFGQTGQSLFQTMVLNQLSKLTDEVLIEEKREYLAPFPAHLAGLYRWLSYFGMGILFFLTVLLAFISLVLISLTEFNFIVGLLNLTVMTLILAWPLVSIWLVQIIYLGIGLLISFLLPIGTLERDPPLRIVLNHAGLSIKEGKAQGESQLLWEDITSMQIIDYQLSSRPIRLFSHLDILGRNRRWHIPAVTTGYENLQEDLIRYLSPSKAQTFTFRLLAHPLNYLVGFLLLPIGVAFQKAAELGISQPNNSSEFVPISFSGILLGAFVTGLLFFPLITFWRLIIHQWQLWHNTPRGYPHPWPSVLVHLFALFWTFLTLLYLHYIYIFLGSL